MRKFGEYNKELIELLESTKEDKVRKLEGLPEKGFGIGTPKITQTISEMTFRCYGTGRINRITGCMHY